MDYVVALSRFSVKEQRLIINARFSLYNDVSYGLTRKHLFFIMYDKTIAKTHTSNDNMDTV